MPRVFWLLVCMTAAGAFGVGMALAELRLRAAPAAPRLLSPPHSAAMAALPPATTGDPMEELLSLRPGDVVLHLDAEHVVAGVTPFRVDGRRLLLAQLVDPEDGALVITEEPRPLATLCYGVHNHAIGPTPPELVQHGGMAWRRLRRLEARTDAGARVEVHLHEGPDGHFLWVLVRDGDVEVLCGERLQPSSTAVLRGPS